MFEYAEPVTKVFWEDYEELKNKDVSLDEIIKKISHRCHQAVSFFHVSTENYNKLCNGNTIEFRCPNGSLNPAIWQNNVNFFVKLLIYSQSTSYNDDLVQKRHQLNLDKFAGLKWYDEIYLGQALELCDMIFTNNFDKVYFLKQYLKSFEVYKNNEDYSKTCSLTKK